MSVSYGHVVRFPWMLGKGWGEESVDDGIY